MAAFAAGGYALLGLGALEADTDYVRFFRSDARVPSEYRALQRAGFPQNPLILVLELPAGQDALATHWRSMDAFTRRLEALAGVHDVLSPFALAPSAEALGAAGRELGMLSERGNRVQLTLMMDYPSSQQVLATVARIRALADTMLPADVRLTATGTSLLFAHMDQGVIRTQRQSLAVVCVVCFAILALLFRSWRLGFVGLLVSLYPVAMVLGLMGLWQIPLNMATVLIAGIAVGLAVDDTIHIVHSWQAHRQEGVDPWTACDVALAEVGVRMVMTSVILVGSFAAMGFSDFMPTAQFGLLSSLTILLALAADLTLLPIVLTWRHAAPRAVSAAAAVQPAWGRSP
jgi:predicted RND superfamily exporter protein